MFGDKETPEGISNLFEVTQLENVVSWHSEPDLSGSECGALFHAPISWLPSFPSLGTNPALTTRRAHGQKTPIKVCPRGERVVRVLGEGPHWSAGPPIPEKHGLKGAGMGPAEFQTLKAAILAMSLLYDKGYLFSFIVIVRGEKFLNSLLEKNMEEEVCLFLMGHLP